MSPTAGNPGFFGPGVDFYLKEIQRTKDKHNDQKTITMTDVPLVLYLLWVRWDAAKIETIKKRQKNKHKDTKTNTITKRQ